MATATAATTTTTTTADTAPITIVPQQPAGAVVVRDARYGDLPAIAAMLSRAFWDDCLLGDLIHPRRYQFPRDSDLWYLRRMRVLFWDYRRRWRIATVRQPDGAEAVLGLAHWERQGPGARQLDLWWFDPRNLLRPLSALAMKLHALLWPNRALSLAYEDVFDRAHPYYAHLWSGSRADCWYLDWCAVDPAAQGRGVGRRLVHWGLAEAAREGICAAVVSAWAKDGFYQRCGFDEHNGCALMGDGNPLEAAGVKGCNIWWRMPKAEEAYRD